MRRWWLACVQGRHVRCFTDPASVLGTTLSSSFIEQVKEDLVAEDLRRRTGVGGFGDTLRSCVHKGDLEHMESPQADAAHLRKVDRMMDNLFARLPTPADPIRAALAPTKEEVADIERFEELKEVVRERYLAKQRRRTGEELRIKEAMKRVEDGSHPSFRREARYREDMFPGEESVCASPSVAQKAASETTVSPSANATDPDDVDALQQELEAMRKRMAELEAEMLRRNKTRN